MFFRTLLAVCVLLQGAVGPTQKAPATPPAQPEPYTDPEAYAVYAALLSKRLAIPHSGEFSASTRLIIQQELSAFPRATARNLGIQFASNFRKEWDPVLEDLARQMRSPKLLTRSFPLEKPYLLVRKEEITAAYKEHGAQGWESFRAQFPGSSGYISLSPVGFNREKTRAIVAVDHSCGELCGGGTHYFLEKRDGKWVEVEVDATVQMWAS